MSRWSRPSGTGPYTSMDQSSAEARGEWSNYSGEKSVGEFESIRRGYLVNAARFDAALEV